MKEAIMSPSILGYPNLFWIQMPVIRLLGQCFFQERDGQEKVIVYMSKSMNKHVQYEILIYTYMGNQFY